MAASTAGHSRRHRAGKTAVAVAVAASRAATSPTSSARYSATVVATPSVVAGSTQCRQAGQDVELELAVFLEETLSKESKQISFQVPQTNAMGQRTGFTPKP